MKNPANGFVPSSHETTAEDVDLFQRKLRSFVPPDSFDAHAHLAVLSGLRIPGMTIPAGEDEVGVATYLKHTREWMGDRCPIGGLFFAIPDGRDAMDIRAQNRFIAREMAQASESRALMLIKPGDDPAAVEREILDSRFLGFKVYHVFADRPDTFNASCDEYMPEWMWEISQRHGLTIMLHLVRPTALSDEGNQRYIREHCLRYPAARLILAHGARGFCADHTVEGIHTLRGLDNVYFDTSAICEPGAFEAILRTFGTRRLMFGTDFTVSNMRGRCTSVGDGFYWMYEDNVEWGGSKTVCTPTLVGIESLLALKQACTQLSLTDADVERIFGSNARELLGITPSSDGAPGQARYTQARQIIPGGTQLLSKRPEMYAPAKWPAYFAEAHGVEVVDTDGRRFIDMATMGIGACLLGYGDPDVNAAVLRRVMLGSACTLNAPEEVDLAEVLLKMHPWAKMARFGRAGGEAMAIAVRIARASSKREVVAFCGYHGWSDWYLAANLRGDQALAGHLLPGLSPAGVPQGLAGTALPFTYNKIDELAAIVRERKQLAAIVMEPTRTTEPQAGFLEGVRELADKAGAALIFDEITCGFRLHGGGGVHLKYGVSPDLAVFAKALGNGFPVAAIIGTAEVMNAAQDTFISSTMWTEGVGPTAGVATLAKMRRCGVADHVAAIGRTFRGGLEALAGRHGVPLKIAGPPGLLMFSFDHPTSAALQTLWTVRMLDRGFLAGGAFYPSLAHEPRHVAAYLSACDEVFAELGARARSGDAAARIGSPIKQSGFARLT